ncbi:hypothetical protein [Roseibium sediminicola]|uniref:Mu-like prophage FluMu N-terminal domain-containing protein n=1 Tax=Roseibium sediminicola TaxID=2933272 RepID=A0ABT0H0I0_9HYPH|nr:hypothetical protein [Roseibium sp. CAU 1639]MCK7615186.1 hypothetical protein [Roseibium sp. CAU 1639]
MASKTKLKSVCLPITLVFGGKTHAPGTPVKLDAEEADALIARHGEVPAKGETAKETPRPKGQALDLAIVSAIKDLDPENEDHFTASGKPVVAEIEKRLGFEVSAEERDAVWAKVSEPDPAKQAKPASSGQASS